MIESVATAHVCAVLMTYQDAEDAGALPDLLNQIPSGMPIEFIGGDRAYDTKCCRATIGTLEAASSMRLRDGATPQVEITSGAG